jgi:hypothetical protein
MNMSITESNTFLNAVVDALKQAAFYNKQDQVAPVAVLWTDKERQWEPLVNILRAHNVPVLTLGPFSPDKRIGPSYWLRCMIARALAEDQLPEDVTPIIYLPGVSRQEIRSVADQPKELKPLAELQYRGVLWTQRNGRDWTIGAFLESKDGGLSIKLTSDQATKESLKRSLLKLAGESVDKLRSNEPLNATYFNKLLVPDEVRQILLWLNDPDSYMKELNKEEQAAFCHLCEQSYGFHPVKEGPITAAGLLTRRKENWLPVWNHFSEAAVLYPHIPEYLRKARPTQLSLEDDISGWPQDNEIQEDTLRKQLIALGSRAIDEIRKGLLDLEKEHKVRRNWVWVNYGWSPMAMALGWLAELAEFSSKQLSGTVITEIIEAYTNWGWKVDNALIQSLAEVDQPPDLAAVKSISHALYRPWLERATSDWQKAATSSDFADFDMVQPLSTPEKGTSIVFTDALRFDIGQRLANEFQERGYKCQVGTHLTAFPTVTPTTKPAISPIAHLLTGQSASELSPLVKATQTHLTADIFRKILVESGYQVLEEDNLGDPSGIAWTEIGTIDAYGHEYGWKLSHHVKDELHAIFKRVESLLAHGWTTVLITTDHGWLLLPGNLPKDELPEHLTLVRKGRCARLKDLVKTNKLAPPWYWDNEVRIATPAGICCFEAGKEYEHGGLSPQECIVPILTISRSETMTSAFIEKITWVGLRCNVTISGASAEAVVDIRIKPGDSATSIVSAGKSIDISGNVSLLVENDEYEGQAAVVVVLNDEGQVCCQWHTTVGG